MLTLKDFTVIPQDDGLSAFAEMLRRDKMDLWIAAVPQFYQNETFKGANS